MAKLGYIAQRFKSKNTRPFPSCPVWPRDLPCLGFVSLTDIETVFDALKKQRHNILGVWTGDVEGVGPLTIAAFETAVIIDQTLPAVLPLQKLRDGHLTSFSMAFSEKFDQALSRVSTVDIWWNGEARSLNLNTLKSMSLADLWPAPDIVVHQGQVFQTGETAADGTLAAYSGGQTTKTVVKKAASLKDDTADVFSGTDEALRELEERTKLSSIFKRLVNQRSFGKGGGKNGGAKGEAADANHKTSLMEDLAGWMRWHTPLANGLIKQMQDRMNTVEKLINRGDIDSALKLALKLGNGGKTEGSKTRFPFRLPEMRSNLNFDFSGARISMPVLGGRSQQDLWQRYSALAQELEDKGDYKRAAYIRSQLLEDHHAAVLTLERGELYAEAAKLSYDSQQDPALTIRLYYKAGKKDEALALARRTGCFDKLAEDSRSDNPEFHRVVIKMWTDLLLQSHQPLRALEVTDSLADSSESKSPDAYLLDLRQDWLGMAIELETEISEPGQLLPVDLLVRALLTAKWDHSDVSSDMMQNFPHTHTPQSSLFGRIFEHIQDIGKGKHPENLKFFLSALFQRANKNQLEQAGFWQGPARKFLDVLTRSVMSHSPNALTRADIVELQRLLRDAPLPVLSLDLQKVKNFHRGSPETPSSISLPPPSAARSSQILQACLLFNGSMIVWYDTDKFEHRDRTGKILWSGKISQVRAIIPIGASPSVLILRQWDEHETRLTLYETHKRRFRDIGIIHLVAWHDLISEREWLVQIDNIVGSLDISKLFQDPAELEFLWSVNTTNELRIIAFFQKGNSSSWMTHNISKARFGVKQVWHYKNARELEEFYCRSHFEEHNKEQIDWYWGDNHSRYGSLRALKDGEDSNAFMSFSVPDGKLRQEVITQARKRVENGYTGADTVQVCDYHRPLVTFSPNKRLKVTSEHKSGVFRVKFNPDIELRLLYRGFSLKPDYSSDDSLSNTVLCTDNFGRLIRINRHTGHVDVF
ncbi:MAG: hypothetical protein ABJN69_09335 [Hellea sp.]